jgi:hypothetical protein
MAWRPDVKVGGQWSSNGLVFETEAEARNSASDLMDRWMPVEDCRAVEVDRPVTHTYINRELKPKGAAS